MSAPPYLITVTGHPQGCEMTTSDGLSWIVQCPPDEAVRIIQHWISCNLPKAPKEKP